jgi:hypothetical protein
MSATRTKLGPKTSCRLPTQVVNDKGRYHSLAISMKTHDQFDEEAATEVAFERNAVPRLRSVLEVERERVAKGHKPDMALEKWGPEIEEQILRDLKRGH